MVKTKREYVLATCFLSGIGAILSLVSIGTQDWVTAKAELLSSPSDELSVVNYGLFSGVFEQNFGGRTYYKLEMTCLFSENVCALLCGTTIDDRTSQLQQLYDGLNATFDTNCPNVPRMFAVVRSVPSSPSLRSASGRQFLNCGAWLSTIIFLLISALFGLFSAALSVWNTAANPIEPFFNVFGLYIYNGIACLSSLLVVLLWGSMFGATIVKNVGILYTVVGTMDSSGLANLGYSYWINLVSFFLYAGALTVLYVRQYLVNQEPHAKDIQIDDTNDPAIYLY